ncbi:hypothetical protein AB1Y20_012860 [Prymnesium parvum]|uniref:Calmodulin-lysine N-methyltransferase n=1 Tax=Prymnesium parvum TaxID=97485 RepID=A0AB34ILY4_PRYPA
MLAIPCLPALAFLLPPPLPSPSYPRARTYMVATSPPATEQLAVRGVSLQLRQEAMATIDSGATVWDAGRALSQLLQRAPALEGRRVLELGSGTGIGGLTAAACGAHAVLTDRAAMLPLLRANIRANRLEGRATAAALEWGDAADIARAARLASPFDLLLGSDVLYAPEAFPDLLETLVRLSTPGRTEVLLVHPLRYTESIFFDAAFEYFDELGRPEEVEHAIWATRLRRRAAQ